MKTVISAFVVLTFLLVMPSVVTSTVPVFSRPDEAPLMLAQFPLTVSQVVGNVKYKVGNRWKALKKGNQIADITRVKFERKENAILAKDGNAECYWIVSTTGGTGSCGIGCALRLEQFKGNCSPN